LRLFFAKDSLPMATSEGLTYHCHSLQKNILSIFLCSHHETQG
jgi:hypothetical protein